MACFIKSISLLPTDGTHEYTLLVCLMNALSIFIAKKWVEVLFVTVCCEESIFFVSWLHPSLEVEPKGHYR